MHICEGQACSSLPRPQFRCRPQHLHDAILTFQITSGSSRLPRPKTHQTASQPVIQTLIHKPATHLVSILTSIASQSSNHPAVQPDRLCLDGGKSEPEHYHGQIIHVLPKKKTEGHPNRRQSRQPDKKPWWRNIESWISHPNTFSTWSPSPSGHHWHHDHSPPQESTGTLLHKCLVASDTILSINGHQSGVSYSINTDVFTF